MIPLITGFLKSLFYDQAAAQRMVATAVALLGTLCTTGGVIPGTETVLFHVPEKLAAMGPLITSASIYLAGGKHLPWMNGHAETPPANPPVAKQP